MLRLVAYACARTCAVAHTHCPRANGVRVCSKQARFTDAAVRVLDFALQDNARGAAHLVDILGLRTVFPLFMGRVPDAAAAGGAASKRKRQKREEDAFDEHMLAVIVSLSKSLEDGHLQRLVAKFAENDFEKVDRTLELYEKFREKLKVRMCARRRACALLMRASSRLAAQRAEERNAAAWSALDEDELYAERLGAGLAPLHSAALLLAFLHTPVAAAVGATGRAQQLLKQQNISAVDVLELLDGVCVRHHCRAAMANARARARVPSCRVPPAHRQRRRRRGRGRGERARGRDGAHVVPDERVGHRGRR
jgi:hypothetical protein